MLWFEVEKSKVLQGNNYKAGLLVLGKCSQIALKLLQPYLVRDNALCMGHVTYTILYHYSQLGVGEVIDIL